MSDTFHMKVFFIGFLCLLGGINSLQTLTDIKNALQLNPLFSPQNRLLKPSSGLQNLQINHGAAQPAQPAQPAEPTHPAQPASTVATSELSSNAITPCTCGVFLSGQFTKGSKDPPKGYPALLQEQEKAYPCTSQGSKQCQNKCLETIIKHLPNSAEILCATIDRDCHKERAYLFIQNCNATWHNSNLSAGREYCCKDNVPYTCPIL